MKMQELDKKIKRQIDQFYLEENDFSFNEKKCWGLLENKLQQKKTTTKINFNFLKWAAILLLFLGTAYYYHFYHSTKVEITGNNGIQKENMQEIQKTMVASQEKMQEKTQQKSTKEFKEITNQFLNTNIKDSLQIKEITTARYNNSISETTITKPIINKIVDSLSTSVAINKEPFQKQPKAKLKVVHLNEMQQPNEELNTYSKIEEKKSEKNNVIVESNNSQPTPKTILFFKTKSTTTIANQNSFSEN